MLRTYHKIIPRRITFYFYNHCKDMMLSSLSLDNGNIPFAKIRSECEKEERQRQIQAFQPETAAKENKPLCTV